jgi:hypothetical protein
VSPLKSRTTYKGVANSVSKFGGILFTPIRLTAVACYAAGPLKVRLLFGSQNVPPPPLKPLHKHWYRSRHFVTAHFSQLTNTACSEYRLLWGLLWVEISTLAYEANSSCWPDELSVAHCTHITQTKVMLKNRIYSKISMSAGIGGPTDARLVVLG